MQEDDSIDDETMHDGMEGDGVMDDVSCEMIGKAMKQYILAFLKVSEFIFFYWRSYSLLKHTMFVQGV